MQVAPTDHEVTPPSDAESVAAAVAAIGPLDREALLLRLRDRSLEQVATETGTTTAMVRVRLQRAAAAIEQRVGALPTDGSAPPRETDRPTDEVVTDAEVGITPVLHARLMAALRHSRAPEHPRFRRLAALVQGLVDRGPQLASTASVAGLAVATATALARLV